MVKCLKCEKQIPDKLIFQQSGQDYKLQDSYYISKPFMLILNQNQGQYHVFCSNICSMGNSHTQEQFDLIFKRSQIDNGIIEKLTNLRDFIGQEVILTENVYKKKAILDIKEEFRVQISKSISEIVDNLTNQLIQHLEEAIKFSMSETEKINCIKQQIEKLLNEQGNINLLNHKGHLDLCEADIKKYRVDEMILLMEKIQQIKKEINQIFELKIE